jgi:hypothetical protein
MYFPLSGWKNKNGTSERSCNCGSWKNHWINNSGSAWPTFCSASDCMQRAEVGAHVINYSFKDEWIIPLCYACNQRTDVFSISIFASPVPANKEKTGC